jgi:hypothetical protein
VQDQVNATPKPKRVPRNKGKPPVARPSLRPDSDEAPDRRPHSIALSAHGRWPALPWVSTALLVQLNAHTFSAVQQSSQVKAGKSVTGM